MIGLWRRCKSYLLHVSRLHRRAGVVSPLRVRRLAFDPLEDRHLLAITLSISDPLPFAEGDSGSSNMAFVVTRSGETANALRMSYHTVDGTAIAGTDYTATSGVLSIPANQTTGIINVPVTGNTLNQNNRTFNVALSDPVVDASFANQQTFTAGSGARSVVAADINTDGKPDLLVANTNSANVSVLLNTTATGATSASFSSQQTFAAGSAGTFPQIIAAEDINGDGRADMVVTNSSTNNVSVFINSTAPGAAIASFTAQQTFSAGASAFCVQVKDLNGDGRPDLVVANYNSGTATVSVLRNSTTIGSTTASFAAQQTFNAGTYSHSVAVADFNGDGKPDLVATNDKSAAVSVLLNTAVTGSTTFSFAARQTLSVGSYSRSVAIGDINGDGRPDIATANQAGFNATVIVNQTATGSTTISFSSSVNMAAGSNPFGAAVGDVNADGRPDILVANYAGNNISVMVSTTVAGATTASFTAQQTFGTSNGDIFVSLADINGDGLPDILAANFSANSVSVLLNTTPAISVAPNFVAQQTFAAGSSATASGAADLNGDGRPDMLFGTYSNSTVSVEINMTVAGTTTASFGAQQTFSNGTGTLAVSAADISGDGRPDLIVANYGTGTAGVFVNTTTPGATSASFVAQQTFTTGGTNPRAIVAGDINGDGKPDLVVVNRGSTTVTVLMNTTVAGSTTMSFAAQQTFATGTTPRTVAVGDINGDGRIDIVTGNQGSSNISVLLNITVAGSAVANFTAQQVFATDGATRGVSIGDFNGDGRPDVVAVGTSASVLLNTTSPGVSTVSFATNTTFAVGSLPVPVIAKDINGDGRADLVVGNYSSSTVSVLMNQTSAGSTTPSFAAQQTFATGTNPQSMAIADFNGDGKPDMLVGNRNASSMGVLLNQMTSLSLGTSSATGTIQDDDPLVTLALSASTLPEQNGAIIVRALIGSAAVQTVTVNLSFSGTATLGTDYSCSAQITIPMGASSGSITLASLNDLLKEGNESVVIDISSVTGGLENGVQQATATILDDANDPFQINGSTLNVSGTAATDVISLQQLSSTRVQVSINGGTQSFTWPQIRSIQVDGLGGGDTLYGLFNINSSQNFVFTPGGLSTTASGMSISGTNVTAVIVYGDATDTQTFNGSGGDDVFYGYSNAEIISTGATYAVSSGVTTTIVQGSTGQDAAVLVGTTGDDTLTGRPNQTSFVGPGYSTILNNWPHVYAYGQGGSDNAHLYDDTTADEFHALSSFSVLLGPRPTGWATFLLEPISFGTVRATASAGGTDIAVLYDTAGDEAFSGNSTLSSLSNSSFRVEAEQFDYVYGLASSGGTDTATIDGAAGNDYLFANGSLAQYYNYGNGAYIQLYYFDTVTANSNGGSDGVHRIDPIDYALTLQGTWVSV